MAAPWTPDELLARLAELGIAQHTVRHPPVNSVEQAKRHRAGLEGVFTKNLFVRNKKGEMWLVVTHEDRAVDLKALGQRLGVGHLSFGSAERLMRTLGVPPGAVTPFGLGNDRQLEVRVALDRALWSGGAVHVHPLDNTMTTALAARDLLTFVHACGHGTVLVDFEAAEPALGRDAVLEAARFLEGQVVRTPVLRSAALDALAGAEVWLKAEHQQHVGAFKARGALCAVGRLPASERDRGVITYSSGNHGQAVALAARRYGVPATVTMPTDAPAIKVQAVRALGAEVVFAGTTSTDRWREAVRIQAKTGAAVVPPFDHRDIVAGQGTATLELIEQVAAGTGGATLDAVLVPVGGGGLVAGACLAASGGPTRIYSVEPESCDAMARSVEAGQRVSVEPSATVADGLKPVQVGELNFAIARRHLAGAFRVQDEEICRAMAALHRHLQTMVEPSGAAALAVALRRGGLPRQWRRVGVILSGGNVAPELFRELCARHGEGA
jgi:threo-3-hydroxy-L-aspartate ammonia-lyase